MKIMIFSRLERFFNTYVLTSFVEPASLRRKMEIAESVVSAIEGEVIGIAKEQSIPNPIYAFVVLAAEFGF